MVEQETPKKDNPAETQYGELVPDAPRSVSIDLKGDTELELEGLSEESQRALREQHAQNQLELAKKARNMSLDAAAMGDTLNKLSHTTTSLAANDASVTITHTQDSSLGRTEMMMGNTNAAQSGKLGRSQTGGKDWTPYYIFAVILAIVLIVALNS